MLWSRLSHAVDFHGSTFLVPNWFQVFNATNKTVDYSANTTCRKSPLPRSASNVPSASMRGSNKWRLITCLPADPSERLSGLTSQCTYCMAAHHHLQSSPIPDLFILSLSVSLSFLFLPDASVLSGRSRCAEDRS